MFDYIKGTLEHKTTKSIVIDNNNIGYSLAVSTSTIEQVGNRGDKVKVYTQFIVKDDSVTLYGFMSIQEREMFNKITSVSGIGSKTALAILSAMTTAELAIALVTEDVKSITRIKGIGQKTAKRMILELKEKVDNDELKNAMTSNIVPITNNAAQEAIQALMALGFSSIEATKAVNGVTVACNNVEELITAALRARGN